MPRPQRARVADDLRSGQRGYHAVYRPGEPMRCPSCGGAHWHVGRTTAECGFCGLPLAIAHNGA